MARRIDSVPSELYGRGARERTSVRARGVVSRAARRVVRGLDLVLRRSERLPHSLDELEHEVGVLKQAREFIAGPPPKAPAGSTDELVRQALGLGPLVDLSAVKRGYELYEQAQAMGEDQRLTMALIAIERHARQNPTDERLRHLAEVLAPLVPKAEPVLSAPGESWSARVLSAEGQDDRASLARARSEGQEMPPDLPDPSSEALEIWEATGGSQPEYRGRRFDAATLLPDMDWG